MMFDRSDPFEEEYFASLLRIVFLICLIYWGRVFCFLHGDGVFDVLEPQKMVLGMLDPLGIVLDLLTRESFDNFVSNWGNLEMSLLFLNERKKIFFTVFD